MSRSSTRPIPSISHRRLAFLALWSAAAVLDGAACGAAYVPVFGGPEYNTTTKVGYQSVSAPYAFERNLVNNSGTTIGDFQKSIATTSVQSRVPFQWHTTGTPPTEMLRPAAYGNNTELWTYAINDSGTVIGAAYNNQLGERPVRWNSAGVGTELANLGTRPDGSFTWGQALAINNAGTVAGYSERWHGGSYYDRAARWDAGGTAITELGELPHEALPFVLYPLSRAQAVNESSTAVGYAQKLGSGGFDLGFRAVRWDGTGTAATELGNLGTTLQGKTDSQAYDVNESGAAVGYAKICTTSSCGSQTAVRWDANETAATRLDTLGGPADAYAINDAGTAVGRSGSPDGYHAVRWDAGGSAVTALGYLGKPGPSSAFDVNGPGIVVGNATKFNEDNSPALRAVSWRQNTVAIDLNNLIDPASGWTLTTAFSISNTNWITGAGTYDPDGQGSLPAYSRYFTIHLPDPLPGDYNADFVVDAADFTFWRDRLGQSFTLTGENPAAATPGVVDEEDYDFWNLHFGESIGSGAGSSTVASAPEPATSVLVLMIIPQLGHSLHRRRQRRRA